MEAWMNPCKTKDKTPQKKWQEIPRHSNGRSPIPSAALQQGEVLLSYWTTYLPSLGHRKQLPFGGFKPHHSYNWSRLAFKTQASTKQEENCWIFLWNQRYWWVPVIMFCYPPDTIGMDGSRVSNTVCIPSISC